ncbi:thioesterase domain-containing protein [Streptomyces sp. M19]
MKRSDARCRLFCLPFPGAAASAFLPWSDLLPPDVELCAVQLPGREDRFEDPW